jgi:hypothetical protein
MLTNLDEYFASPILVTPNQSQEEWRSEAQRMFAHSRLTQMFVSGQLCPDDYMDGLADLGENPLLLEDLWAEGHSLLLPS